ncbi:MAG: hypothetical protein SGPRY_004874 [Prymnesium sp.]
MYVSGARNGAGTEWEALGNSSLRTVETPIALVAASVGVPAPMACAKQLSWAWEEGADEVMVNARQLVVDHVQQVVRLVLVRASPVRLISRTRLRVRRS